MSTAIDFKESKMNDVSVIKTIKSLRFLFPIESVILNMNSKASICAARISKIGRPWEFGGVFESAINFPL